MIKIELNKIKDFGDATSMYTVKTNANTINEFINTVIETDIAEYGDIRIYTTNSKYSDFEYEDKKIVKNLAKYDKLKHESILNINCIGGWGRMDYIIRIKPQNRNRARAII